MPQHAPHPLWDELNAASASLHRCPCGSKAIMQYEPGCTFITCLAERETKLSTPDWNPQQLAHDWNQQH